MARPRAGARRQRHGNERTRVRGHDTSRGCWRARGHRTSRGCRRARGDDVAAAVAGAGDIRISEDGARWENAYGEKFFQVVGSVTNGGTAPVGAVRVRVELLDAAGAVVGAYEGWNGRAEALGDLEGAAARARLAELLPAPIAPGESDRFRSTFLADETPDFRSHRVRVLAVLPPI